MKWFELYETRVPGGFRNTNSGGLGDISSKPSTAKSSKPSTAKSSKPSTAKKKIKLTGPSGSMFNSNTAIFNKRILAANPELNQQFEAAVAQFNSIQWEMAEPYRRLCDIDPTVYPGFSYEMERLQQDAANVKRILTQYKEEGEFAIRHYALHDLLKVLQIAHHYDNGPFELQRQRERYGKRKDWTAMVNKIMGR